MTHSHTPGPWSDTGSDGRCNIIVESNTGSVCAVWRVNGYVCQAADARLIAAAPELLAAAVEAAKQLRLLDCPAHSAVLERAIAKATA